MALDKTFSVGEVLSASDANAYMRSMWAPIDKQVIPSGSPVTSLTFSSIDTNFRIFRMTFDLQPSTGLVQLKFNNDSGANYTYQYLLADASDQVTSGKSTGNTNIAFTPSTTERAAGHWTFSKATASLPAFGVLADAWHSSFFYHAVAAKWNNTSALINRIDLTASSGNFYGIVALEGMRGS